MELTPSGFIIGLLIIGALYMVFSMMGRPSGQGVLSGRHLLTRPRLAVSAILLVIVLTTLWQVTRTNEWKQPGSYASGVDTRARTPGDVLLLSEEEKRTALEDFQRRATPALEDLAEELELATGWPEEFEALLASDVGKGIAADLELVALYRNLARRDLRTVTEIDADREFLATRLETAERELARPDGVQAMAEPWRIPLDAIDKRVTESLAAYRTARRLLAGLLQQAKQLEGDQTLGAVLTGLVGEEARSEAASALVTMRDEARARRAATLRGNIIDPTLTAHMKSHDWQAAAGFIAQWISDTEAEHLLHARALERFQASDQVDPERLAGLEADELNSRIARLAARHFHLGHTFDMNTGQRTTFTKKKADVPWRQAHTQTAPSAARYSFEFVDARQNNIAHPLFHEALAEALGMSMQQHFEESAVDWHANWPLIYKHLFEPHQ